MGAFDHLLPLLVSLDQERGPTIVGDDGSDPELMLKLDASKVTLVGNDL